MPLKTVETKSSVYKYVDSIKDKDIVRDSKILLCLLKEITKKTPKMWGTIIGFGKYTYRRKGSKEDLEWFNIGLAPRKSKLTLYLTCYLENEPLVKKLGKVTHGKGCLHIRKLEDVDIGVLKKLIIKYKDGEWHS